MRSAPTTDDQYLPWQVSCVRLTSNRYRVPDNEPPLRAEKALQEYVISATHEPIIELVFLDGDQPRQHFSHLFNHPYSTKKCPNAPITLAAIVSRI